MYPVIFLGLFSLICLAMTLFYLRVTFPGKEKREPKNEKEVLKELSKEYKKRTKSKGNK